MMSGNCLIRGGSVIDGTGAEAFRADVRVRAGRISEIGLGLPSDGELQIDASGCVVTPGFIDSHTHYDAAVFWDPRCDPSLMHGVTSVLIGNCGLGMAPLRLNARGRLASLFSYIEDLPKHLFETEIPWSWETYPEYADHMRSRSLGLNVASLVSHSLLRQYVIGDAAWERASTTEESEQIAALAAEAIRAGAFGVSTSRFDRSPDGRHVPSFYADDDEFDRIFAAMAPNRGVMQLIPTQDDPNEWDEDLRRMGRFSARHGCPVFSNFIGQDRIDSTKAPRLMALAKEIRSGGGDFRHMMSPRPIELILNFKQSIVMIFVPSWNAVVQGDMPEAEKRRRMADPAWRADARKEWDAVYLPRNSAHLFEIIESGAPQNEKWVGRTFGELVAERGKHPSDVMADWALENDLKARFLYKGTNTDPEIVGQLLAAPENIISGSDAGAHIHMFDGAGDATLVLTRHVRERGDLTLEEAVRRMTSEQARFLGIPNRGIVANGAFADLTIFDLNELTWDGCDVLQDVPGGETRFRRRPGGFRYTIVNGEIAQAHGEATHMLPGRFLSKADQ